MTLLSYRYFAEFILEVTKIEKNYKPQHDKGHILSFKQNPSFKNQRCPVKTEF